MSNKRTTYQPLPEYVSISESDINGLGLVAVDKIFKGHYLGITHIKDNRFKDGYIRTPLGGFINHSNNPNCELQETNDCLELKTLKNIKPNEELTVRYKLYLVDEEHIMAGKQLP
jgi:SET domain-containing protein|tara:strand:- start:1092 stop:1436 length:345 start_codon:yes stop_codon:yes gene_type:complete